MSFEQSLLEQIAVQLHCKEITHIRQTEGFVSAWVSDIVDGKDWQVPVLINLVPSEPVKDTLPERILQICFTLSQKIDQALIPELAAKLNELNGQSLIGTLHALPFGEICYLYRLPLVGESSESALRDFSFSFQLMLTFLFEFYPYILVLAADPSRFTLKQYLDMEV